MLAAGAIFNLTDHWQNNQGDDDEFNDANDNLRDLRGADKFAAAGFKMRFMNEDSK